MDFFIWNIKTLIFFSFFVLIRVNPSWPGLIHETQDPVSWPGQPRAGFNNYSIERGRGGFWFLITEDAREIHVKIWQSDGLYFSNVAKMMTWLLTNILTRETQSALHGKFTWTFSPTWHSTSDFHIYFG